MFIKSLLQRSKTNLGFKGVVLEIDFIKLQKMLRFRLKKTENSAFWG